MRTHALAAAEGGETSDMKLGMNIVAIAFLLIGVVWTLQGMNVIGGSFMTGQPLWLSIGLAVSVVSLVVLYWLNMRR
jgi:hypothetical protein